MNKHTDGNSGRHICRQAWYTNRRPDLGGGGAVTPIFQKTSLFADDILLYRPIQNIEDFAFFHNNVTKLCSWTNDNLLDFNANKCKYMFISKRRQPFIPVVLTVNGSPLERVDAFKHLGIWITSDLTWSKQVMKSAKKARQKIGILYHNTINMPHHPPCCNCTCLASGLT